LETEPQNDAELFFLYDSEINIAEEQDIADDKEFIYYSLKFSGVKQENIALYISMYSNFADTLSNYIDSKNIDRKNSYAMGETILFFVHDNLLKKYFEFETEIDTLFDKGFFNCVSSSIIYYALAWRNNLDVRSIRTKDHAFCAIFENNKIIDVETTIKYGFDPGEKKEFKDSFGRITGFAYTPPSQYSGRKEINRKELISIILQNRIFKLQKKNNYTDTVPLIIDIYNLLKTKDSFNDMVNEFKNHAVMLLNKKEYKKAIMFLSAAAKKYGYVPVITDTAGKIFYNCIASYINKDLLNQAYDFYNAYSSDPVIPANESEKVLGIIKSRELYLFITQKEFNEAHDRIFEYYKEGLIQESDKNEYLVFIFAKELQSLSQKNNWQEAYNLAQKGIAETGGDPRMVSRESVVRHNIAVTYHNKYAELYNKGDKNGAFSVLSEGLKIIPNDKTLMSDMQHLKGSGK
jgi:hypothetical protein